MSALVACALPKGESGALPSHFHLPSMGLNASVSSAAGGGGPAGAAAAGAAGAAGAGAAGFGGSAASAVVAKANAAAMTSFCMEILDGSEGNKGIGTQGAGWLMRPR